MPANFVFRTLHASLLAVGVAVPLLISPAWHAQAASAPSEQRTPAPPREYVDTRYTGPGSHVVQVPSGADLQAALDKAQPGDTLVLQADAVYTGPFTLRAKDPGGDWITLVSSDLAKGLPAQGTRVTPADAAHMPKLQASYESVVRTAPGAGHYRLVGLEIRPGPPRSSTVGKALNWMHGNSAKDAAAPLSAFLENLMVFGSSADSSLESLPDHIIVDRCYLHGDPAIGARRGIAMNARTGAVVDSYISDIKKKGEDAQAISGWNGPGPYKIVDDYLEAAGENVMFGGQDPTIKDLVPSDIEVRGNHLTKQLAWKSGDPSYQGTPWQVKNIFELKNAQRVLVEGNLLENNWAQAQTGYSILFTVRDQDGGAPWSVVQDVTFKDNVVRHVANGVNVLGQDDDYTSQQAKRILIANNLFEDVGGPWGSGNLLLMDNGSQDVTFTHNTAIQTGSIIFSDGKPDPGFNYTDNIAFQNSYGIIGTNRGPGMSTISVYFPGVQLRRNAIVGANASLYPSDNFFPHSVAAVGFVGASGHNYRLAPSSAYKAEADDGGDIGVDMDELCKALDEYGQHLATAVQSCGSSAVAMH
ncbi:MAG TPA: hypothetical protein VH327_01650 [Gammaproteobacteria bacterium]|jgi:hypothetical protein|nr:hypothetical protein [Gammaproteobacteria bacterium]